jgi:hypothetical protein
MRFESLEQAQAYLDRWEERWADTRIHGTTKGQVAVMFAEEKPHLLPLPLEQYERQPETNVADRADKEKTELQDSFDWWESGKR